MFYVKGEEVWFCLVIFCTSFMGPLKRDRKSEILRKAGIWGEGRGEKKGR